MKISNLRGILIPSFKKMVYTEEEIALHNLENIKIVPIENNCWRNVWKTRNEVAEELGISPETVRGKVQKGQIERIKEDGNYYYRVI